MNKFTVRKPIVFVALMVIAAAVLAACSSAGGDTQSGTTGSSATPDPSLHLFTTGDPHFDSSYRITMHLLDGYTGEQGGVVFGTDDGQGMSAWTVGNVYAEPCKWAGTLLDPPIDPSVDGLVAGLTSQKDRHATAATDVSLSGFTGKYMEMTTPAGIDVTRLRRRRVQDLDRSGRTEEPRGRSARPVVDRRRRRHPPGDRFRARAAHDTDRTAPTASRWWSPSASNRSETTGA